MAKTESSPRGKGVAVTSHTLRAAAETWVRVRVRSDQPNTLRAAAKTWGGRAPPAPPPPPPPHQCGPHLLPLLHPDLCKIKNPSLLCSARAAG